MMFALNQYIWGKTKVTYMLRKEEERAIEVHVICVILLTD